VAYGPVFPTASKVQPDPCVGVQGLRAAWARASAARIPLVAIGGITLERAREVASFTSAVAVIAALLPPATAEAGEAGEPGADVLGQVASRARQLQAVFGSTGAVEARP
jgi:thiamine-phosphate pyrophosphorylase